MELDTITCMDALTWLRTLPDESVNCMITSPPYNLLNSSGNGLRADAGQSLWTNHPMQNAYTNYTDNLPNDVYIEWQQTVLIESMRILKPNGAIFYNHKWRVQDNLLQRLGDDITRGLPVRQIIIWSRLNGVNFNSGYFLPTYEVIYLIANSEFVLQPKTNVLKDVWVIPPYENKQHPNAFPLGLAENCILSGSAAGDIICDPFIGSGQTAVACRNLGRHFIGCDISQEYVDLANKRLRNTDPYQASEVGDGIVQHSLFE